MFPLSVLTSSEELATVEPLIQMSSFQHRHLFREAVSKPKHLLGAASQDCSKQVVLEGVMVQLVLCLDRMRGIWSLCIFALSNYG